jgi:hypothetical protein
MGERAKYWTFNAGILTLLGGLALWNVGVAIITLMLLVLFGLIASVSMHNGTW